MNRVTLFVIVTCLVSFSGCATVPRSTFDASIIGAKSYRDFVPIDPLPSGKAIFYVNGQLDTIPWNSMTNDQIRKILPNQKGEMTIEKLESDGQINYLGANISGESGHYRIILDYMKYMVEDIKDEFGRTIGIGRVGVGLRMKAAVQTIKSGIDFGSLIAIGVAYKQGFLNGTLSVESIGMESPEINNLFPTPSQIDETGIQKALEALAAIKAKLSDSGTTLTPQIVAVKVIADSVNVTNVRNQIK